MTEVKIYILEILPALMERLKAVAYEGWKKEYPDVDSIRELRTELTVGAHTLVVQLQKGGPFLKMCMLDGSRTTIGSGEWYLMTPYREPLVSIWESVWERYYREHAEKTRSVNEILRQQI